MNRPQVPDTLSLAIGGSLPSSWRQTSSVPFIKWLQGSVYAWACTAFCPELMNSDTSFPDYSEDTPLPTMSLQPLPPHPASAAHSSTRCRSTGWNKVAEVRLSATLLTGPLRLYPLSFLARYAQNAVCAHRANMVRLSTCRR